MNDKEVELLCCCARVAQNEERTRQIREIVRQEIDWDGLLVAASGHGLMPLLYTHLQAVCPQDVPESVMARLKAHFQANTGRNLFLTGELLKLLQLFAANDIPAVPYKGPALAASVYGALALREFGDLDVLVRKQDVLRARDLLIAEGFRPSPPLTPAQETILFRGRHHYNLMRDAGHVLVELHWCFAPRCFPFDLVPDQVRERLDTIQLGGTTISALCAEDLLLVLCVHGANHCWAALEWITGVAELINTRTDMDWARVLARATELGMLRILLLGFCLAHDLLGTDLPGNLQRRVQAEPVVRELAEQVRNRLVAGELGEPGFIYTAIFHMRSRERLRDRLRHCTGVLTSPTTDDLKVISLPRPLIPLYYAIRIGRLLGNYRTSTY